MTSTTTQEIALCIAHGSTESSDSGKSGALVLYNNEEEFNGLADENSGSADGESIYIEDDPENDYSTPPDDSSRKGGPETKAKLQGYNNNNNRKGLGQMPPKRSSTPTDSSGTTMFTLDEGKQIHRTSQVVDSILRQFVDDSAKAAAASSGQSHKIKKPISYCLPICRTQSSQLYKSRMEALAETQMMRVPRHNSMPHSDPPLATTQRKATSRVRDLAEAVDEIRKLGKKGEAYLAQMGILDPTTQDTDTTRDNTSSSNSSSSAKIISQTCFSQKSSNGRDLAQEQGPQQHLKKNEHLEQGCYADDDDMNKFSVEVEL